MMMMVGSVWTYTCILQMPDDGGGGMGWVQFCGGERVHKILKSNERGNILD